MVTLSVALCFVLGLAFGSLINVIVLRARTGMTLGGRSICLSCGKILRWYELIPIFSYVFQRGRCLGCGARISAQYPIVELALGGIFGALAAKHGVDLLTPHAAPIARYALDAAFFSSLFAILVYDLRHKIIPDGWVAFSAALALLSLFLVWIGIFPALPGNLIFPDMPLSWHVLAAPLLAAPFALIWMISGGRAMGLGDAKLILAQSWFLGASRGLTAVILAFWIAAVLSLVLLSRTSSGYTMKSEIPFGPFLALAAALIYLSGFDLLQITW